MDGGGDQRENLGGVEEDRGQPRRRPVIRLSGAVAPGAKSRSRARTLEPAPSKHPSSSADALKGATQAAQSLLNAVDQAAAQLGDTEIDSGLTAPEILADPQTRESASRWRAGNAPRRVTSALARLTTSLKSWMQGSSSTTSATSTSLLAPTRARPLLQSGRPTDPVEPPSHLMVLYTWFRAARWRTGLAALSVLMFPKVVALIIALIIRLWVRATMALLTHVGRELFLQIMSAASDIEDNLVSWLTQQLGGQSAPAPSYLTDGATLHTSPPATTPTAALPARPFDLVTVVLLVWNLQRGLPAGGGGNGQG